MEQLDTVVNFCDDYLNIHNFKDFKNAYNGLEFENSGTISKIGSAVDCNLLTIEQAIKEGIDFLIVHHGMFWGPTAPITNILHQKYKLLCDNNIAVYSSHLPLDCHKDIGNNISVAKALDLKLEKYVMLDPEFEFHAPVCSSNFSIKELSDRINTLFLGTKFIQFGPKEPGQILICTGSIGHSIRELSKLGIGTLITGEIQQHMFGFAYENRLNVFVCGHYATETFGVQNLSNILAEKFSLPSTFLPENCEF